MTKLNVKIVRKITQSFFTFFHNIGCTDILLWGLARIPTKHFFKGLWITPAEYYVASFDNFLARMGKFKVSHNQKSILELGSGNSFGWGYLFIIEGAGEYTSSDMERAPSMSKRALRVENELIRLVEQRYGYGVLDRYVRHSKNSVQSKGNKLQFKKLDITSNTLDDIDRYDVIISNAVLEHIHKNKIDKAVKNMYRLLKKNGNMLHHIDLRDHFNLTQKFNFYRYSDERWSSLTGENRFYTNRLRASDYVDLFRRNGFKVTHTKRNILKNSVDNLRKNVDKSFLHYSDQDLQTMSFSISLQKRGT